METTEHSIHAIRLADLVRNIVQMTDTDEPDSFINDHPRDCAEAIADFVRHDNIRQALLEIPAPCCAMERALPWPGDGDDLEAPNEH